MEKIKIVIADDHTQSRTILRRMLEQMAELEIVAEAENGEQLLESILTLRPDAVFIDISMPKKSGLESIRESLSVLPDLKIVFITAHSEYAAEAFTINAVDYIVKPIERLRLHRAVEKVRTALQFRPKPAANSDRKLILKSDGYVHLIPIKEIIFIEKIGRKSFIHTKDAQFQSNETLASYAEKLDETFFQSHRSFIINLNSVKAVKNNKDTYQVLFFETDQIAYVAKNKMDEFLEKIDFSNI